MRDRLTALGAPCPTYRVVADAADAGRLRRRAGLAGDRQDLPRRLRRQGRLEDRLGRRGGAAVRRPGATACSDRRGVRRLRPRAERAGRPLAVGPGRATRSSSRVQRNGICVETITPAPGLSDRAGRRRRSAGADDRRRARRGRACSRSSSCSARTGRCSSTSWPCGRTTPATGPSTGRTPRSSRTTSGPCWICRSATRVPRVPWTVMVNVLGGHGRRPSVGAAALLRPGPRLRVQLYGKQVRPGRKVGHVTARSAMI